MFSLLSGNRPLTDRSFTEYKYFMYVLYIFISMNLENNNIGNVKIQMYNLLPIANHYLCAITELIIFQYERTNTN